MGSSNVLVIVICSKAYITEECSEPTSKIDSGREVQFVGGTSAVKCPNQCIGEESRHVYGA